MDYEKLYKEALERAKKWYYAPNADKIPTYANKIISEIFPELEENGDEKIRKTIIECVKNYGPSTANPKLFKNMLAWLEKQGECNSNCVHITQTIIDYINKNKEKFENDIPNPGDVWNVRKICTYPGVNNGKPVVEIENDKGAWMRLPLHVVDVEKQGDQKELNLVEILKHYPRETEMYSPLYGKLWLAEVDEENEIISCYRHPLNKGCTRAILEQEDTISFYANGTTALPDYTISKECMLFLYNGKKQDEQKPDNKTKPKFKLGDWITDGEYIWKVTDISQLDYILQSQNGDTVNDTISYVDEHFHLWAIQDAKDGGVLCCENGWTCIFKALNSDISFSSYCFMDSTEWFCETGSESHTLEKAFIKAYNENIYPATKAYNGNIYPATKEQRDLLFQKMKDAGYEWDFEVKELNEVKKKPTLSEEDKKMENINISYTIDEYVIKYDHMDFSGKNTERFDSLEKSIERLKKLKLRGCFNFEVYHMIKEVFDTSKILKEL